MERATRTEPWHAMALAGALAAAAAMALAGAPGTSLLIALAVGGVSALARFEREPIHLMRTARATLHLALPAMGAGVSLLIVHSVGGTNPPASAWLAAAGSAALARAVTLALVVRHHRHRPCRIGVVGSGSLQKRLEADLEAADLRSFAIVGAPDPAGARSRVERGERILHLRATVEEHDLDLLVADLDASPDSRRSIHEACRGRDVAAMDVAEFYERHVGHVPGAVRGRGWNVRLMHPDAIRGRASSTAARACEIAVAAVALILTAPIVAMLAALVRLTDGGPAFYRQKRVGLRGKEFQILKIRSMEMGSAGADGARNPEWTKRNDVRVTSIGRFMRRAHLDELPQLVNVLRGDMSLVGPRPEQPAVVGRLAADVPDFHLRHAIRPGITGWSQVHMGYANTTTDAKEKLARDLITLRNPSLSMASLVLIETATAPFKDPYRRRGNRKSTPRRGEPTEAHGVGGRLIVSRFRAASARRRATVAPTLERATIDTSRQEASDGTRRRR